MTLTPSHPLEYVCLFQPEFPIKEGGCAYIFLAVDVFSKFSFNTGAELNINKNTLLKHVQILLDDTYFKMHRDKGFTLVSHQYNDW